MQLPEVDGSINRFFGAALWPVVPARRYSEAGAVFRTAASPQCLVAPSARGLCHRSPLQADQALDVVDEVDKADLACCSGAADGPDERPHPGLFLGEDMLDVAAHLGLEIVGPTCRFVHRLALGLLAMDATDEAIVIHELFIGLRAIGRVGPDLP